ncbi:MAG: endonuclease/exonuclease/phosphatase family protein [Chloroflexi bacterium]|nr:endonuclease/exonuclease/phosphatase family protein [Chloroflexota bacterium]
MNRRLCLMTYNVQDGGAERLALIAEVIAASNSDIILLNEADDERAVHRLGEQLSYQPLWARGSGDKHIGLLTRLPVVGWRCYNRRPLTQAVLSVVLKSAAGPINLYGVHLLPYFMLLPFEIARWRTVRALLTLMRRDGPGLQVVLGDFNAVMPGEQAKTQVFPAKIRRQLMLQANWQARLALAAILRAGYVDCFRRAHPTEPGLTWMPSAPSARLDYIFADSHMAMRLQDCAVITAPPAAQASDHYPLIADFLL